MKLYTYFRSSAAYRVRIALNLKKAPHTLVPVSLLKAEHKDPAYTGQNPQGFVPMLDDDGAILTQSLSIIDYLDQKFPEPALYPAPPQARAIAQSMALIIACDIHPLDNLRVLKYLKTNLGQEQDSVDRWYRHWIVEGFTALEAMVAQHGGAHYCFGDSVSVVDLFLAPQMYNARRFETDLSAFPRLTAIDQHLNSLDAFKDAAPENQPDAS